MQEQTTKTVAPLPKGSDKVRPYTVVKIVWKGSAYKKEGTDEEVHTLLADKMIKAGKAVLAEDYVAPIATAADDTEATEATDKTNKVNKRLQ